MTPIIAIIAIFELFVIIVLAGLLHWASRTKDEGIHAATVRAILTADDDKSQWILSKPDTDPPLRICEPPYCPDSLYVFRDALARGVRRGRKFLYTFKIYCNGPVDGSDEPVL